MMNRTLFILCIILISLFFSCNKEKDIDYLKFKEIAWNSLSNETQQNIVHKWQDAQTEMTTNPDNKKDKVVIVYFHSQKSKACPISVYVDVEKEKVISPVNRSFCI